MPERARIDSVIDGDTMQDLIIWLCRHEDDIKHGINDFADLHGVFVQLIGREPCENVEAFPW